MNQFLKVDDQNRLIVTGESDAPALTEISHPIINLGEGIGEAVVVAVATGEVDIGNTVQVDLAPSLTAGRLPVEATSSTLATESTLNDIKTKLGAGLPNSLSGGALAVSVASMSNVLDYLLDITNKLSTMIGLLEDIKDNTTPAP